MLNVYLILIASLLTAQAWANCPWMSYREILRLDSDRTNAATLLSAEQVKEDLACFRLVANHYVYEFPGPPTQLLARLSNLEQRALQMSASTFMRKLFELHEGFLDAHVGYQLQNEELTPQFPNKIQVKLKQALATENIHRFEHLTYFRPENFFGSPTPPQLRFIQQFSQSNDRWVLDLRGNGGGDSTFANELTKALFTPEECIPQERSFQNSSLLVYAGLLNITRALQYRGEEQAQFERDVLALLGQTSSLEELLNFWVDEDSEKLTGERSSTFNGELILLVDGGCASSCEGVVTRLSVHPNVRVLGQNTFGALHYSNPAMFQLPHSGIIVRIPTLHNSYENDVAEGIGHVPDVLATEVDLDRL